MRALLLLVLSLPALAAPSAVQTPYLAEARAQILPLFAGGEHLTLAGSSGPQEVAAVVRRAAALPGRGVLLLGAPTAAGKSTLAAGIAEALGSRMKVFPMDEYFKPIAERPLDADGKPDFDHPDSLKLMKAARDIAALLADGKVELAGYDFASDRAVDKSGKVLTLGPDDVLVVDSIYASHPTVTAAAAGRPTLNVFLSAPAIVRLKRRLKRDTAERGLPVSLNLSLWGNILHDEKAHIQPLARKADVVLDLVTSQELRELPEAFARLLADEWAKAGKIDGELGALLKRRIAESLAADRAGGLTDERSGTILGDQEAPR